MLQIHNNLTKKKEPFIPLDPKNVRMYVCGMTVYDYCHIGHARVMVVFDVVNRYLRHIYGDQHVTYIRNITDIDDKIIKRANENGEPFEALTARFIAEMNQDSDALGMLRPDQEPLATKYIHQIIDMIQTLVARGHAYPAKNGDVYYDVSSFETYGQLSGKQLEDLRAGSRVEVDEAKDDPLDFVLWKAAKPGEPSWDSPWGVGRPGWHIECSAMSTCCLGNHFDLHGGGLDLQFPHHENEIAQSEGATGEKFVNVWMHNGFVRVDDEKMSKSLGNFFTIRDVLQRYDPEVVRYFILSSHYRSPLNYSDAHLNHARSSLTSLYISLRGVTVIEDVALEGDYVTRFLAAMDDDFNTPLAMSVLFELSGEVNRAKVSNDVGAEGKAGLLKRLAGMLGLLGSDPESFLKGDYAGLESGGIGKAGLTTPQIDALLEQRLVARQSKNWEESDRIRDLLKEQGIIIEDGAGGKSTWRRE